MNEWKRKRLARIVGAGQSRVILWAAGQHAFTQLDVLLAREHAHRVFNAMQALVWGMAQCARGFEAGEQSAWDSAPTEEPR